MSKDKIFGLVIMIVGVLLAIVYSLWGLGSLLWQGSNLDMTPPAWIAWFYAIPAANWAFAVVIPLWLIVILVCIIAIWIGYSMLTTPPPVPLEELEEELEKEEAASAAAEKKPDAK